MEIGTFDFELQQGSPATYTVAFKQDTADGAVISFNDYSSAKMQVKRTALGTAPAIVELSTTNGKLVLDKAGGTITMIFSSSDTVNLKPSLDEETGFRTGTYYYDLDLVLTATSEPVVWLRGTITVNGEVTR